MSNKMLIFWNRYDFDTKYFNGIMKIIIMISMKAKCDIDMRYFIGKELDDFLREFVSSVHTEEEVLSAHLLKFSIIIFSIIFISPQDIDFLRDYQTGGCLGQAGVRRSPRGAEKVFLGGLWRQQWWQDWYQRGK